jgi:hypothetical protein
MAIPTLYWSSLKLASPSISDAAMWSIIQDKMKEIGLSDVKKNPSDVNGHSQDTIVATTFVKLGQQSYMLIIMAAGNHALELRDQLYDQLNSVIFL